MSRALLEDAARQHALPPLVVAQLAAAVAERCALIANREGAQSRSQTGPTGAHIGAAILAAFRVVGVPDAGWTIGEEPAAPAQSSSSV